MKTKLIYVSIIAIMVILLSTISFASSGTVDFKANVNQIKKGETFTVTLSVTSEEGINGIDTKYVFDSEKLELISESVIDSTKWVSIGNSPSITVICNSTDSIKKSDIYEIKFKVKDNVTVGDKIKIETTSIMLDTDAATNSEVTIPAKKIELSVIETTKEKQEENQKDTSKEENNLKDSNSNVSDNKEVNKNSETTANTNNKVSTNTGMTDSTVAVKKLPKTGINILVIITIIITIILAITFYIKYRQNKYVK